MLSPTEDVQHRREESVHGCRRRPHGCLQKPSLPSHQLSLFASQSCFSSSRLSLSFESSSPTALIIGQRQGFQMSRLINFATYALQSKYFPQGGWPQPFQHCHWKELETLGGCSQPKSPTHPSPVPSVLQRGEGSQSLTLVEERERVLR